MCDDPDVKFQLVTRNIVVAESRSLFWDFLGRPQLVPNEFLLAKSGTMGGGLLAAVISCSGAPRHFDKRNRVPRIVVCSEAPYRKKIINARGARSRHTRQHRPKDSRCTA